MPTLRHLKKVSVLTANQARHASHGVQILKLPPVLRVITVLEKQP